MWLMAGRLKFVYYFFIFFLVYNIAAAQKAGIKFLQSSVPFTYSYSSVMGQSTAIDKNGNVFSAGIITANVNDTISFSDIAVVSNGIQAGYIAKYSSAGAIKWLKLITSLDSTNWWDQVLVNRVAVDDLGNCYISGNHHNTIVIGKDSLKGTGGFLTKIDTAGNYIWSKRIGGSGYYNLLDASDIVFDKKGNIYIGGNFDYGNNAAQYLDTTALGTAGESDSYLAKFSPAGKLLWYKTFGIPSYGEIYNGFTLDSDNNIYFNGSYFTKFDSSGKALRTLKQNYRYGNPVYSSYENCIYSTVIFSGKLRVKNTFVSGKDYKFALAKYDTAFNLIDLTTITEDYDFFTSNVIHGVEGNVVLDKDFNPIVFGSSDAYGTIDDNDTVFNKTGDNNIMFFGKFDKNLAPVWFEEFEGSFFLNKLDIAAHESLPQFAVSGTYFGKLKYYQDSIKSYRDTMVSLTESTFIGLLEDKDKTKGLVTILGDKYICKSGIAEYKVKHAAGTSYTWKATGGKIVSSKTDTNAIRVQWDSSGTNMLTLEQKFGPSNIARDTVRVKVFNQPKAIIVGDTIVCRGTTTRYTAKNKLNNTYEWFLKNWNNKTRTNEDTFTVTWNDTGYNEIKLVQGAPFSCKDSVTIRVYVADTPKVSIGGKPTVCINGSYQYWINNPKKFNCEWSVTGGTILTSPTKDTITVRWDSAGSQQIHIEALNATNCKGTAVLTIKVSDLPVPKITGRVTVCRDKPATFQAGSFGSSYYEWQANKGTFLNSPNSYYVFVNWKDTGFAYIKLIENTFAGCKDSVMLEVYVTDTPNPVITGPELVCKDAIGVYITPHEKDVSIEWDIFGGTIISGKNNDTLVVRWNMPGYNNWVRVAKENALGCKYARTLHVKTQDLPFITISGNSSACRERTSLFTANTKEITYLTWAVKGGQIIKGQYTDSIIVHWKDTLQGEIKLVARNTNGCKDSSIIAISLPPMVKVKFGADNVCYGESTQFKDSSKIQPGYAYHWNFGDGNTSSLTSPTHKYALPGKYNVSLKISGKCSDSLTKTVTVYSLPAQPKITKNDDSLIATIAVKYLWYKDGNAISGAVKKYFVPYASGAYKVAVSDSAGCTSLSAEINVRIKDTLTGTVTQSNNQPLKNSKIYLLKIDFKDTVLSVADSTVTDNQGKYAFALNDSLVFLMAVPNATAYPNELPTYFDTGLTISHAAYIFLKPGTNLASWQTISGVNPGGNGIISGKIKLCKNCKKEDEGEPVNYLKLILINDAGQPVDITYTNAEGQFNFSNIALGNYSIWVDKLLIDNDKSPKVSLTTLQPQQKDLRFTLYERQLVLDSSTGIQFGRLGASSINIFPNPFTQYTDVVFELEQSQKVSLSLISINGKQHSIYDNLQLPAGKQQFRISKATYHLLPGIYFLQLKTKEGIITRKIVLQ